MGLSDREILLIEVLLRHPYGLTAEGIAERLGVSARTVHRELQPASEFLDSHGLTLLRQAGRGVSVEGAPQARERALSALREMGSVGLTPEERRLSLLCTMLAADQPIKLRALASGLDVAVGTVSRDLDEVEEWLTGFRLSLLRKRGYGVEVVGDEGDRRRAMSRLIFENLDESRLFLRPEDLREEDSTPVREPGRVADQLMGMIGEDRLRRVEALTENVVASLPYSIADSAFVSMSVHVALMVERRLQGGEIEMDEEILQRLRNTEEYEYARRLAADIEEDFRVAVPEEEVGYLTMHLRGTKLREDDALRDYFETSDLEVASQVKALIRYVEEQTGISLAGDSSLYTGLLAHLERAIHRLREHLGIHNPLLSEVKEDYPALFDLVSQAMDKVFVQEKVPEEEVGFVAMHFGAALDRGQGNFPRSVLVICSSGIGTSKILASRLGKSFPQIQTIRDSSLFELDSLNIEDFDLVVSTVPLPLPDRSYVQVRPFLTDDEVERIRNHLLEKSLDARLANRAAFESLEVFGGGHAKFHQMAEATQVIAELVDDAYLAHHEAGGSLEVAVRRMCASLAGKDLVSDPRSLEESLLSRMELGGIGIPGTVLALFHARDAAAVRPSFSVHDFDEPLELEGLDGAMMRVRRSLLMVAPLTLSPVALEAISEISAAMVEQPVEREVFEDGSEARIIEVLQNIFARFLHNKLS
ncbi:MAG TPA: BglG family transcription antiterminator [Rubrobacteraceae bacterium]|nr:BglG family transcription antiterminator [Rubrobacteraceae bacterium]